jgi:hypothetical protein
MTTATFLLRFPSRFMASSSLISPALSARNTAYNSSSCHCSRWRSQRKEAEKARRCSAASTSQLHTVLASTSKTRAVARIPKPCTIKEEPNSDRISETVVILSLAVPPKPCTQSAGRGLARERAVGYLS